MSVNSGTFTLTGNAVTFDIGVQVEGVSISALVGGVTVYGLIIPDQDPNYVNVSPDQNPTWSEISPNQSPSWQQLVA